MTVVSTMATTKDERIYIRTTAEIKSEFETVAEYRGLTPSALLHSLIVQTIHRTREEKPELFNKQKIPARTLDEAKADNRQKMTGKGKKNKKSP